MFGLSGLMGGIRDSVRRFRGGGSPAGGGSLPAENLAGLLGPVVGRLITGQTDLNSALAASRKIGTTVGESIGETVRRMLDTEPTSTNDIRSGDSQRPTAIQSLFASVDRLNGSSSSVNGSGPALARRSPQDLGPRRRGTSFRRFTVPARRRLRRLSSRGSLFRGRRKIDRGMIPRGEISSPVFPPSTGKLLAQFVQRRMEKKEPTREDFVRQAQEQLDGIVRKVFGEDVSSTATDNGRWRVKPGIVSRATGRFGIRLPAAGGSEAAGTGAAGAGPTGGATGVAGRGALTALGTAAARVVPALAGVAASAIGGVGVIVASVRQTKQAADAAVQDIRGRARFSPTIANAIARFDSEQTRREFRYAEGTSRTSKDLTEASGRLADSMLPLETVFTNVTNRLKTASIDLTSGFMGIVNSIIAVNQKLASLPNGGKPDPNANAVNPGKMPIEQMIEIPADWKRKPPQLAPGAMNGPAGMMGGPAGMMLGPPIQWKAQKPIPPLK